MLITGVTPFPYKVVTILSGATALNLTVFIVASVVARGLRSFVLAGLLWRFGRPIRAFVERRLGLLFTLFCLLLVGGFVVLRYLCDGDWMFSSLPGPREAACSHVSRPASL